MGSRLIGGNGSVSQGIHFQTIFIVKPIAHKAQRERKDTRSFIFKQPSVKNFLHGFLTSASKNGQLPDEKPEALGALITGPKYCGKTALGVPARQEHPLFYGRPRDQKPEPVSGAEQHILAPERRYAAPDERMATCARIEGWCLPV
ncbi:MAG: hypothetical protein K2L50_01080 [Bacteroidales bacterium]|nr:hypothetical protein [Bacteroidales bacterium]